MQERQPTSGRGVRQVDGQPGEATLDYNPPPVFLNEGGGGGGSGSARAIGATGTVTIAAGSAGGSGGKGSSDPAVMYGGAGDPGSVIITQP